MKKRSLARLVVVLVSASFAAVLLAQPPAFARTEPETPPPGEGVICAWAIYSAMAEVGSRCHPGEDVEVQKELTRAVASIDAYVIANSTPAPTPEQIEGFKRSQGSVGDTKAQLCRGDMDELYGAIAAQGAPEIRRFIDELVARPGPPTWGDCI